MKKGGPTEEQIALLGTAPDAELARRWGRHPTTVWGWRMKHGLPRAKSSPTQRKFLAWRPEWNELLRADPLRSPGQWMKELGVARGTIHAARKRLGLPNLRGREWLRELNTATDEAIAAKHGIAPETVANERRLRARAASIKAQPRWNPEWNARLGTVPDQVLAAELGVSWATVRSHRIALGIAGPRSPKGKANERARALSDSELMEPSDHIHKRTGLAFQTIQEERYRRGIYKQVANTREATITRAMVAGALAAGAKLQEIADRLGFTRQRADQIAREVRAALESAASHEPAGGNHASSELADASPPPVMLGR